MATTELTIYGNPISQPARAVMWALAMKDVPFKFVRINPMKGEAEKDEYLAMFPTGLIPGMVDGNVRLSESHAILTYLAETRRWDDWYPQGDVAQRARINQWLHWHHSNARMITLHFTRPIFVALAMGGGKGAANEKATKAGLKVLKEMELVMKHGGLNKTPFLCGAHPTLADIAIYCEVDQLEYLGIPIDLKAVAPTVWEWAQRMKQLPKHDEARTSLVKLRKALASKL